MTFKDKTPIFLSDIYPYINGQAAIKNRSAAISQKVGSYLKKALRFPGENRKAFSTKEHVSQQLHDIQAFESRKR